MTEIKTDNALLTEKGKKVVGQDEKKLRQRQKYLKQYENKKRNQNGLTILGGVYNKFNVLLDFDMLEFRKEGKVMNYIFLNDKQRQAFRKYQNDEDISEEILYGGGAGGGKSFILTLIVFINAIMLPGSGWFIGRRVLKDVRTSTIVSLTNLMDSCGFSDYNHNKQDGMISFTNKSFVKYGELENLPSDTTFKRLGSFEYTGVFIDEAQETVVGAKSALRFRLRLNKNVSVNEDGSETIHWKKKGKMYYSCNPGKNWLFTDFYLPFEQGKLDKEKVFIQALPRDNEFLDDMALAMYENSDNELFKQIYLYGNWHYDDDPTILFNYDDLNQMFLNNLTKKSDEWYITADVSGQGADKTIIVIWKGYEVIHIYKEDKSDSVGLSDKIKQFEKQYGVKRKNVVIDATGIGSGTADILKGCVRFMGAAKSIERKEDEIRKINGNEKDHTRILYANDRSACFFKLGDLVKKGGIYFHEDIDKEDIINEFSFIKEIVSTSDTIVRKIISKEQIKKFLGNSPDFADAISMRMVFDFDIEEEEYDVYSEEFTIFG